MGLFELGMDLLGKFSAWLGCQLVTEDRNDNVVGFVDVGF